MNKKKLSMSLVLIATILVLSGFHSSLRAYERRELVEPASVIVCVSDVEKFLEAIEQSSVGQLWNSKEMKPFLNNQNLAKTLRETFFQAIYSEKPDNKELSHLSWESARLLKGELVVGFSPSNRQGKQDLFIAAAIEEEDYLKSKRLDERIAELDDDMAAPHRQDFQGVDLYRIDRKTASDDSESEWESFYGGTLVSSTSREWVERCIVRLKKELPVAPPGPPTLYLRLNDRFVKSFLDPQEQSPDEEDGTKEEIPFNRGPSPSVVLNALGFDQLKSISLDLILKPEAVEFQLAIKTKGGERKGIWTLLTGEHVPLKHRVAYVPADVYSYQVMRLDFNALWGELPEILKSINPLYIQYLKSFNKMFTEMYRVDLSRDVFGNLGTLITTFSRMEKMKKQELFVWQLRNPDAMEKLLAKLYGEGGLLGAQLQDRLEIYELHGHKLYTLKPGLEKPETAPPLQAKAPGREFGYIVFSVVDGALVFGSDKLARSLIQATVNPRNSNTNTLYQKPIYTAMMRQVPDDAVGFAVLDISRLLGPMLEFLRNPLMIQALKRENQQDKDKGKPGPLTEFLDNLRFDRLPPVDFMTSFFGTGVSYTRLSANETITRGIFLYREENKR